jgi:hypothetical protein
MPLLNAFPAAGGGSIMLRDKYRMPPHWRLFTIILRILSSDPGIYKLICVFFDGFETFGGDIVSIFLRQFES